VVDDERDVLQIYVGALELEGYEVHYATSGFEGLEMVGDVRPDLILLDLWMPGIDGRGFALALTMRGVEVPIVLVTGAEKPALWAEAIGAVALLEKPFDVDELVALVDRVSSQAA
jgi:two-component system nitrogen regulation response regulator NtrX